MTGRDWRLGNSDVPKSESMVGRNKHSTYSAPDAAGMGVAKKRYRINDATVGGSVIAGFIGPVLVVVVAGSTSRVWRAREKGSHCRKGLGTTASMLRTSSTT